jgi:hypothetical protein
MAKNTILNGSAEIGEPVFWAFLSIFVVVD